MQFRYWLLSVVLYLFSNLASAEGRCPPGMFETGSRDYIACAPLPGYGQGNNNNQSAPPPPPIPTVWEKRWGAIATEFNGAGFGAVKGSRSEAAATQAAVEQCRNTSSKSKTKCEVQITYNNQCAAYAWGAGKSVAAHAVNTATATSYALASCKSKSGSECKIYYSGCSYAQAVPK